MTELDKLRATLIGSSLGCLTWLVFGGTTRKVFTTYLLLVLFWTIYDTVTDFRRQYKMPQAPGLKAIPEDLKGLSDEDTH